MIFSTLHSQMHSSVLCSIKSRFRLNCFKAPHNALTAYLFKKCFMLSNAEKSQMSVTTILENLRTSHYARSVTYTSDFIIIIFSDASDAQKSADLGLKFPKTASLRSAKYIFKFVLLSDVQKLQI